ncbi:hypothetical protein P4S73_04390 [Paraglaciecola sp. Hal342]
MKINDIKRVHRIPKTDMDKMIDEENKSNDTGMQFYDLSHEWGLGQPCWPYF